MREWWERLNSREHWVLGGGTVLVLTLLVYTLAWQPFQRKLTGLRQSVVEQRTQLAWMRGAAQEVKRLGKAPGAAKPRPASTGKSLLTLVDQTAKTAGVGTAVKRVEPQGSDKIRVRLEQVEFDKMIRWLGILEQQYAVKIDNAVIDRHSKSGRVNVRLILKGATP